MSMGVTIGWVGHREHDFGWRLVNVFDRLSDRDN